MKYFWSFIQPANELESESYWNILADQNMKARAKLRRIPTDLLEATTNLNNKIIGENAGPAFVRHY